MKHKHLLLPLILMTLPLFSVDSLAARLQREEPGLLELGLRARAPHQGMPRGLPTDYDEEAQYRIAQAQIRLQRIKECKRRLYFGIAEGCLLYVSGIAYSFPKNENMVCTALRYCYPLIITKITYEILSTSESFQWLRDGLKKTVGQFMNRSGAL